MLKFGIISEMDPQKGVARVKFEDDDIVSDWLRISVPNTIQNKDERWFDVNEPVWCIMDDDMENGVIGGAYYHEGNVPAVGNKDKRVVTFSDGTSVEYDRSSSTLTVNCTGTVNVVCTSGQVTVDTPTASFTGDVEIGGGLSVTNAANFDGSLTAQGQIESMTQVKVGLIGLTTHKHSGVTTGGGITATPTP